MAQQNIVSVEAKVREIIKENNLPCINYCTIHDYYLSSTHSHFDKINILVTNNRTNQIKIIKAWLRNNEKEWVYGPKVYHNIMSAKADFNQFRDFQSPLNHLLRIDLVHIQSEAKAVLKKIGTLKDKNQKLQTIAYISLAINLIKQTMSIKSKGQIAKAVVSDIRSSCHNQ